MAHSILVSAYYILTRQEPYQEVGGDYFTRRAPAGRTQRLARQIAQLGYRVQMEPVGQPG